MYDKYYASIKYMIIKGFKIREWFHEYTRKREYRNLGTVWM